jgi:tetratricopeptide (TPR) repeat protein
MNSLGRLAAALALILVCSAVPALAQFRPPPTNELEQTLTEAEQSLVAAAKAFTEGDKATAQRKNQGALERFEHALALQPDSLRAAVGYGAAAHALGEYPKLVAALGRFEELKNVDLSFYLGVAHYKLKNYDKAAGLLEIVAPSPRPEFLVAHYYLGVYSLYAQRGEKAVAELNSYLDKRPANLAGNDGPVQEMLGRAYLLTREATAARQAFNRAQAGGADATAIDLGLEGCLELEGKLADARSALERIIVKVSKSPEPRVRLVRLLLRMSDVPAAEAAAKQLVSLDPSANSQVVLGEVQIALKQFSAAEATLRKAVALAPNSPAAVIGLARALNGQSRYSDVISLLEKAAPQFPQAIELWAILGSAHRKAKQTDKALEAHQHVTQLAPAHPWGHLLIGADHYGEEHWPEAIAAYEKVLELDPSNADGARWLAGALGRRGQTRAEAGRWPEATEDFRRANELAPGPETANNLAAVLLAQGNTADARTLIKAGNGPRGTLLMGYAQLDADPAAAATSFAQVFSEPSVRDQAAVGWALAKIKLGAFDEAIEKLKGREAARRELPFMLLDRAFARLAEGDLALARSDLKTAEQLSLTSPKEGLEPLFDLARAQLLIEEGKFPDAAQSIERALPKKGAPWAQGNAAKLASAYLELRRDKLPEARKLLPHERATGSFALKLAQAIERREAVRAIAAGKYPLAEKALKAANALGPKQPSLTHDLACLLHRRGKAAEAVASWASLTKAYPAAWINLGIDAQERQHNPERAYELYGNGLSQAGSRAGMLRQWRARLATIYGFGEAPEPKEGAAP